MGTTNLFAELVIIGLGALAWLGLVVMAMTNASWADVEYLAGKPALALPALAIVYLLGVVTDRIADQLFHTKFGAKLQGTYRGKDPKVKSAVASYHSDRAYVLQNAPNYAEIFDYSRSRQRVCRGSALNSLLLIPALAVHTRFGTDPISAGSARWLAALLVLVTIGCIWTWRVLVTTELLKLADHAEALRRKSS